MASGTFIVCVGAAIEGIATFTYGIFTDRLCVARLTDALDAPMLRDPPKEMLGVAEFTFMDGIPIGMFGTFTLRLGALIVTEGVLILSYGDCKLVSTFVLNNAFRISH